MSNGRLFLFAILMTAVNIASATEPIRNWIDEDGITESEARVLAQAEIQRFLAKTDDGETCTAEEFWGFAKERVFTLDDPKNDRGPYFAISGYARGPYQGCNWYVTYDCRVLFNRPPATGRWQVAGSDCE